MKGSAIIIAFILIVVGSLIVGGFLLYVSGESRMTKTLCDSIKGLYIAEAGLERAISDLTTDSNWFDGDIKGYTAQGINTETFVPVDFNPEGVGNSVSFGGGEYSVEVMKIKNHKVTLKSNGTLRGRERTISEDVSRSGIFDWAFFGDEGVELKNSALIDSYNSEDGPYDPDDPGSSGDTGTNSIESGSITLKTDAKIDGDAVIGEGGDIETSIDNKGTITGEESAADSQVELPENPPVPENLADKGTLTVDGNTTISGSGRYESISINNNTILTIDADATIYVGGILLLKQGSEIDITNGAEVIVYINGSLDMKEGTKINDPGNDPQMMTLYATDNVTSIELKHDNVFYGSIYARKADAVIKNSARIYGAIAAKTMELKNSAAVHYDEALAGTGPGGGKLKVSNWKEVYE